MNADYRYSRLGYVALNVTDLARTLAFYTDIVGLDATGSANGQAALRCGPDHHNILLTQAPEPGLKRIGFELESEDDLERAFGHLERRGYAPAWLDTAECAALRQGRSLRFHHPGTGLPLEYFAGMERMADPFERAPRQDRPARAYRRLDAGPGGDAGFAWCATSASCCPTRSTA